MSSKSFKFLIKEYFKLSTGAVAFVGLMEPNDYPLITQDNFVVKIESSNGKLHIFHQISEDMFSRKSSSNEFRSLQTFENMDDFIPDVKNNSVYISGYKK